MKNDQYALKVGVSDYDRLSLLSGIYLPANTQFLLDHGLIKGIRVADVGCGPGLISLWLSQQVGETGHVTAIDNNAEQLAILKEKIDTQQIKNISLEQVNIYELGEMGPKFNLIMCRFLLIHLTDPIKALRELYKTLLPGGKLIVADLDNLTWYSYPAHKILRKEAKLLNKAGKLRGIDFSIGPKLPSLLKKAGFNNIDVEIVQPVLKTPQQRNYLNMKIKIWGHLYLSNNLISTSELNDLSETMQKLVLDDNYLIAGARMFQVCGSKM